MALFSWVPFHRELARRVLDFEHERGRLIELHHRQVDFGLWEKPKTDARVEKVQEPLFDIDPSSFFATFIEFGPVDQPKPARPALGSLFGSK